MYATDFLFDTNRLSDFNCIICSFDGEPEPASGGEIEFNVVKSPNKDRFLFYGAQFNTVLTWNFSICKNVCSNNDMHFDQYEESMLANWLLQMDGYKYFQFDQDGYDVNYRATMQMTPHQIGGKTVGFNLTVTTDCGYGYSSEITRKAIINATTPLKIKVNNDIKTVVYPYIKINGTGSFHISNDSDTTQRVANAKETRLDNVFESIILDCENDVIEGLGNPNDFSYYFPRLVSGENIITTNSSSDIEIEIKYREVRRVLV